MDDKPEREGTDLSGESYTAPEYVNSDSKSRRAWRGTPRQWRKLVTYEQKPENGPTDHDPLLSLKGPELYDYLKRLAGQNEQKARQRFSGLAGPPASGSSSSLEYRDDVPISSVALKPSNGEHHGRQMTSWDTPAENHSPQTPTHPALSPVPIPHSVSIFSDRVEKPVIDRTPVIRMRKAPAPVPRWLPPLRELFDIPLTSTHFRLSAPTAILLKRVLNQAPDLESSIDASAQPPVMSSNLRRRLDGWLHAFTVRERPYIKLLGGNFLEQAKLENSLSRLRSTMLMQPQGSWSFIRSIEPAIVDDTCSEDDDTQKILLRPLPRVNPATPSKESNIPSIEVQNVVNSDDVMRRGAFESQNEHNVLRDTLDSTEENLHVVYHDLGMSPVLGARDFNNAEPDPGVMSAVSMTPFPLPASNSVIAPASSARASKKDALLTRSQTGIRSAYVPDPELPTTPSTNGESPESVRDNAWRTLFDWPESVDVPKAGDLWSENNFPWDRIFQPAGSSARPQIPVSDRRHAPRLMSPAGIVYFRRGDRLANGEIGNLSNTGALIHCRMSLPPGSLIPMALELPTVTRPLKCLARIVYVRRLANHGLGQEVVGLGIAFEQMDVEARQSLADYLARFGQ